MSNAKRKSNSQTKKPSNYQRQPGDVRSQAGNANSQSSAQPKSRSQERNSSNETQSVGSSQRDLRQELQVDADSNSITVPPSAFSYGHGPTDADHSQPSALEGPSQKEYKQRQSQIYLFNRVREQMPLGEPEVNVRTLSRIIGIEWRDPAVSNAEMRINLGELKNRTEDWLAKDG
ncbi:hypothetical protein NA57DRAFT_79633 [Rhizodiscina lignyota]|uniref:Uncharacterized protein n=1 Tax=Rhizodiscina lignyota TaxID=1504668 RepID=A0A9P4I7Z5_9PEZI|nr:hypothetical protein NA57DRAFT_79633 [Rhizodiscina lignyota]